MLRALLSSSCARLKDMLLTYGKWVEENEYYLDCCW